MSLRVTSIVLVALFCLIPAVANAQRTVVLVTNESCPMETISTLDVRKAYFGIVVNIDGTIIRPFRLNNDSKLNQIFLQSVIAMSEKSYERRLLSLVLKYGTPRPDEFDNVAELADALRRSNCSIAYMFKQDADELDGIRTVKLLWHGE